MFLEFLFAKDKDIWNFEWLSSDRDFVTVNSFISESSKEKISQLYAEGDYHDKLFRASKIIKEDILTNHIELVKWLTGFPLFYERGDQIYTHGGVDEQAEEYWRVGTSDEYFLSKYPASFGKFYKYIIAGHISTSLLTKNKEFHDVYWDGQSHFFLDGETIKSGVVPVLKYNTTTFRYSSFKKKIDDNGVLIWEEYLIK